MGATQHERWSSRGIIGSLKTLSRRSFAQAVTARAMATTLWTALLAVLRPARASVILSATPISNAADRVDFLKLAWDAVGSEFASRHTQYEMFYAGARFVTTGHSYRTFDWSVVRGMVDQLMSTYDLDVVMPLPA